MAATAAIIFKVTYRPLLGRVLWYLKQLLPLRYETEYREHGILWFEIWRMWFGRCFAQRRYALLWAPADNDANTQAVERITRTTTGLINTLDAVQMARRISAGRKVRLGIPRPATPGDW